MERWIEARMADHVPQQLVSLATPEGAPAGYADSMALALAAWGLVAHTATYGD